MKSLPGLISIMAAALLVAGCTTAASDEGDAGELKVYATTGYLADAAAEIAPTAAVETMVGPGGDPHTYQPSTRDIETLQSADLVLWNGLHLEAQMLDLLEQQGERQLAVAEEIPEDLLLPWPETSESGEPLFDPHVWNSPEAWSIVVEVIATKLAEVNPAEEQTYRDNAEAYRAEIAVADESARELLADIPEPRVLVTGHDAFSYYGETYDLRVEATDFISTEASLSATELSELADFIAGHEVPVIFRDNQANPQAITSLREAVESRGHSVEVSDAELFADSLGPNEPVDTFLGVFEHNTHAIAEALAE